MKRLLSLTLAFLLAISMSFVVFANEPIVQIYDLDKSSDLNSFAEQKDLLAEKYYREKTSGNYTEAAQTLKSLNQLYAASGIVAFSKSATASESSTRAFTNILSGVTFYRQEEYYYCGPATAYIILKRCGVPNITQDSLADELETSSARGTPFTSHKMEEVLNDRNTYTGINYIATSKGSRETMTDFTSRFKSAVVLNTDNNDMMAMDGLSRYGAAGYMSNYPTNEDIYHWLGICGYNYNGDDFYLVDPASGRQGFTNVPQKYFVTATKAAAFASANGYLY